MRADVREAEPSDVPGLEVVRRQAVESGFADEYDRSAFANVVAEPSADLREWIAAEDALALVVESDVTIAAYGVYDRTEGAIRALYTAPDYERHGCASALVDRFERVARGDDAGRIAAVAPRNAVPFFVDRGFERVGTVERDGLEFVELAKPLEPATARD